MPRLLHLLPALGREASTFQPCVLLPRGAKQRLVFPISNNATMADLSTDATGATNTNNTCSPSYRRSASCTRVGGVPSKHCCLAVTSSRVLLALCLLNTELERFVYYSL
jgi:hypothetical protein